jgi:hypothetical protein
MVMGFLRDGGAASFDCEVPAYTDRRTDAMSIEEIVNMKSALPFVLAALGATAHAQDYPQ